MINICDAIHILSPESRVIVRGESLDMITWTTGNPRGITKDQIQEKLSELQAAYDAQAYARARETEYPSIQEQLDLQYWDKVNSTSKWDEAVKAVKDKHPKG